MSPVQTLTTRKATQLLQQIFTFANSSSCNFAESSGLQKMNCSILLKLVRTEDSRVSLPCAPASLRKHVLKPASLSGIILLFDDFTCTLQHWMLTCGYHVKVFAFNLVKHVSEVCKRSYTFVASLLIMYGGSTAT
jgi:hypothetical protein